MSTRNDRVVAPKRRKGPLFHCPIGGCSRSYVSPGRIFLHVYAHHPDIGAITPRAHPSEYVCTFPLCNKSYRMIHCLERHIVERHWSNMWLFYKCDHRSCRAEYDTALALLEHKRAVHTEWQCPYCRFSWRDYNEGIMHYARAHPFADQVYTCWLCPLVFASNGELEQHHRRCPARILACLTPV